MLQNTGKYVKPHGSGEGSGGNTIIYNINNNALTGQELNIRSINANQIDTNILNANTANITDASIVYLMSGEGVISKLTGDELNYTNGTIANLNSDNIKTNKLTVNDTAYIRELINETLNSKNITTDYLTVNKSAHFFEVIIDKIRSTQGTEINTAANCVIDYVEAYDSNDEMVDIDSANAAYYRVYWKNTDDDGKTIDNQWLKYDQAICQSFNIQEGVNHDVNNKYYWRLVGNTDNGVKPYINFNTGEHKASVSNVNETQVTFGDFIFTRGATVYSDLTYDIQVQNITDTWDSTTRTFTASSTAYGIQVILNNDMNALSNGTFSFTTTKLAKLNIGIFYDDGTFQYNPSNDYTTSFSVTTENTVAAIEAIVITVAELNTWNSCNWIDLSNTDMDTDITQGKSIPSIGDNLAQLGYRYTDLSSTDLTDLGYNSSSTDAAGQSLTTPYNDAVNKQAWVQAHKDEIARASAIIIAAYATPDSGGTYGGRTYPPIYPPSYAQYKNIIDYTLFKHRGTYMDATGGYFAGNLVSESGNIINIDDQLSVDVDYYSIISEENPITKPTNTKTVKFRVLHVLNGEGEILNSTNIQNLTLNVNGTSYTATQSTNYFTVTVDSSDTSLDCKLYLDNALKDQIVISVIDFDSVTDGKDGAYNQWIYKATSTPVSAPTSDSTYPPTGWNINPPTITGSEYVVMSTRTVTPSDANPYGNWSTPIRITGSDGQPGTDGTDFEFIYTLSQISSTEVADPAWVPSITEPTDHTIPDYTPEPWSYVFGDTIYTGEWEDHPQGISSNYMYEYMAQRYSYINNGIKYWSNFTTPALWSKYGENGIDGDGVEYIFRSYTSASLPNDKYPDYNSYQGKSFTDDDFVPSGWADNPMSPTSTLSYVFVSQRKQKNGEWIFPSAGETGTPWSTPAIWSKYAKDGNPGQTGPQGEAGENGVVDKLVPYITRFEIRTTSTDDYSNIVSKLYANLQYQVWHADGDTVSQVTGTGLNNYSIRGTVRAANRDILIYQLVTVTGQDGFVLNNDMFKLTDGSNYYMTNMLDYLGYSPSDVYHDYRKLSQSSLAGNYLPIEIYVELLYNNQVVDSKIHEVVFKAGHVFEVTDAALNSAFFGSWKGETGIVSGMSSIRQDMGGIETNVSTLSTNLGNLQTDYSSFKETSTTFQTNVTRQISTINGNVTTLSSVITQTADSIKLGVYEQSTMGDNLFKKPDFPTDWNSGTERWKVCKGSTEVTTPSNAGISRETRTDYIHDNHTSISINMAYDMSGYVFFPNIQQNIYDSSYIPAGTNIMMSMYVKMQPATGQTTSANSVIGMDIYNSTSNSSDTVVLYFDNKYVNTGYTNSTRSWAQVGAQYMKDTNWHYFQYMCKTKVDLKLNDIKARIFGWHSGTDDSTSQIIDPSIQPTFYVSEPVFAIDNSGVTNDRIKNTGIDIENGKITLKADNTDIVGNLNIFDSDIGLSIYNNNNICANISNSSVGTFQNFDTNNLVTIPISVGGSANITSGNYNVDYYNTFNNSTKLSIGYWPTNETITINPIKCYLNKLNEVTSSAIWTKANYTIYIYNNGTLVSGNTITGTFDPVTVSGRTYGQIPTKTYTTTSVGNYSIEIHISWTTNFTGNATTTIQGTVKGYNNIIQTIGNDGALFKMGDNKNVMFATDSIDLRNKNSEIRLTETAILRPEKNASNPTAIQTIYGDLSSTVPYRNITANYTVNAFDGMILCNNSSSITVTLPATTHGGTNPIPYGKLIYIVKGNNNGNVSISSASYIYSKGTETNTITLNANNSYTLIASQNGWHVL